MDNDSNALIDPDFLVDSFRDLGPDGMVRLIEGRGVFEPEERPVLVTGPGALALKRLYAHTEPSSYDDAVDLQSVAVELGQTIPKLQLAIRATNNFDERRALLAVLDAAMHAHRELCDWSSRAGEYQSDRAKNALSEYRSLIQLAKDLAVGSEDYPLA